MREKHTEIERKRGESERMRGKVERERKWISSSPKETQKTSLGKKGAWPESGWAGGGRASVTAAQANLNWLLPSRFKSGR